MSNSDLTLNPGRTYGWPSRDSCRTSLLLLLASVSLIFMLGCGAPEASSLVASHWTTASDSTGFRPISGGVDICATCIDVQVMAVLGDTSGDGYVVQHTEAVVRDRLGRFWVGQQAGSIRVFDRSGTFIKQVGRPGQGPLEFVSPQPVYADAEGLVHIVDAGNLRESIVDKDFALVRDGRLPARFGAIAKIGDADGYVINGWIGTTDAVGMPIHIVRGQELERSFGLAGSSVGSTLDPFTIRRILAVDRQDRIFSTEVYEYTIEAWDSAGHRLQGWKGAALNARTPSPGRWTIESPPPSRIEGMQVDDAGRLWILSVQVKENWRELMDEELLPTGQLALRMKPGYSSTSLYSSRIEVLDLNSGSLIASRDYPNIFVAFIGDSLLLETIEEKSGTPRLAVWRADFIEPS